MKPMSAPSPPSTIAQRVAAAVARHYLGKPDQEELLRIKFPDPASLWHAAGNEIAYLLGADRSFRLTTLNVEVTNRCNLRCAYCPVNRDMERAKVDLPFERFVEVLDAAPTVTTLLPFQWGEPLLHPRIVDMIEVATRRGIRTYLTTNGTLLDDAMNRALLRSGLARLTVSVDGADDVHEATRGVALGPIRERVLALKRLRDELGSPLRIDVSMVVEERTEAGVDEFFRAWSGIVDRVQAIPRFTSAPRASRCREPWRGLLVILADGRTTACCVDSEGRLDLGRVPDESPPRIWNGEAMARLRRAHAAGDLPEPCRSCAEYRHPSVSARFA